MVVPWALTESPHGSRETQLPVLPSYNSYQPISWYLLRFSVLLGKHYLGDMSKVGYLSQDFRECSLA